MEVSPIMDKKDIYEVFNEVDFEAGAFEEVPMNDLEKQRMKKILREKLEENNQLPSYETSKKTPSSKRMKLRYKIAAVIALVVFLLGVTPMGRDVLAAIKDKLFFNPSYGIINGNKVNEIYTLDGVKRVKIGDDEVLIKSIINNGEYITVEMWIQEETPEKVDDNYKEEYSSKMDRKIKDYEENLKLRGESGESLGVYTYGAASGGMYSLSFKKEKDKIIDFDLYYKEEKIQSFTLVPGKFATNYDELGGNTTSSGVLVGATSYYQEEKRYFKLWSNLDTEEFEDYFVTFYGPWKGIEVTDDKGNKVEIESAEDGTGKAFRVLTDYRGPLHISLKEIEVAYNIHSKDKTNIKLPRNGETIELNEEIEFKGLQDKVVLESIRNIEGEYTITFNSFNNYDKNRNIYMISPGFRSSGAMGDPDNRRCELYIDKEDLKPLERIFNKVNLSLDNIQMIIKGNWNFIVE